MHTATGFSRMLAGLAMALLCLTAEAQTKPVPASPAGAELAQAKARVRAAERRYQEARDRVLSLREERERLSRQHSADERRKIETTTGWSKRADAYATQDLRDSRSDLNQVRREEARATTRLEEAKRELERARKALAVAEQRAHTAPAR